MYEMDKRFGDEPEAKWLSLTSREKKYIEALSFPQKQLEGALNAADSTDGDVVDIVAKDFINHTSGDKEIINKKRIASFGYFHSFVGAFNGLFADHYDKVIKGRKPSGTYFTLEEPISPRCFLPDHLSKEPVTRIEELYVALTALRKVWQSNPPNKENYLQVELERRFFNYFFREQFESTKPNIRVQEFSYTPLPGQFQFRVQYIYL